MKFIDTGFFISAFMAEEENHAKTAAKLRALAESKETCVYSDYILDELLTWVRNRRGKRASLIVLDTLLESDFKLIRVQEPHIITATELFRKYESLSFTDCTTVALMWDRKIGEICSLDSDFDTVPHIARVDG